MTSLRPAVVTQPTQPSLLSLRLSLAVAPLALLALTANVPTINSRLPEPSHPLIN
jgi:hypothetical protein